MKGAGFCLLYQGFYYIKVYYIKSRVYLFTCSLLIFQDDMVEAAEAGAIAATIKVPNTGNHNLIKNRKLHAYFNLSDESCCFINIYKSSFKAINLSYFTKNMLGFWYKYHSSKIRSSCLMERFYICHTFSVHIMKTYLVVFLILHMKIWQILKILKILKIFFDHFKHQTITCWRVIL